LIIREWWEVGCEVAVKGTNGQANGRGVVRRRTVHREEEKEWHDKIRERRETMNLYCYPHMHLDD
jgi:hypothetical protein